MKILNKIWEFIKSLFGAKTPTKPAEPHIAPIKIEDDEIENEGE